MAIVVEPILTMEKLLEALSEAHEQPALDYKRRLDLSEHRDLVDLTKDVAAMQSEDSGGYIVIGADDNGAVVPELTDDKAELFDEARLRSKLKKFIAEPIDVRTARHIIDGNHLVLLYVAPHRDGWCIFVQNGAYQIEHPAGSGKKAERVVFQVGDVFVRHGTASEKWIDADRERLLKRTVNRYKEQWRAEMRAEFSPMFNDGLSAQKIQQLPSAAVTWKLDAEGFDELVVELMRRNDDIPLRRMLMHVLADASSLIAGGSAELTTLLDRTTSAAAIAMSYERTNWFERALETLVGIYEYGFDQHGYQRNNVDAPRLWLEIVARVVALGGLAVRLGDWRAVRLLADRSPHGHDLKRSYGSWLRHSLTMASRTRIIDEQRGLIAWAHNVVRAISALHTDADAEADKVLNSLCQFDALAGLVVIGERSGTHRSNFYPSFSRYYAERTIPAFVKIVSDQSMRKTLFDGDDRMLADAIAEMSSAATREGFSYDGWDGLEDERVAAFVRDHRSDQDGQQHD